MASHPTRTARLWSKKLLLFFNARELGIRDQYDFARDRMASLRLPLLTFGLLLPFGVLGAYVAWPRRRELGVLYGVLFVQVVSFVLIFVLARYRLVFVACLMPFAAYGVTHLVAQVRAREWSKLAPGLLILVGVAAVSQVPLAEFPRDRGFADQYKFVADSRFVAEDFESAAAGYVAALGSRWQDDVRSTHLRWESMNRLALARVRLGQLDEARDTLIGLVAEMEQAAADSETIEPIREFRQLVEAKLVGLD